MQWKTKNNKLVKELKLNNFVECIELTNKIKEIAESQDHHPDIFIYSYNNIRIEISTHEENKITQKDYKLAKAIDELI